LAGSAIWGAAVIGSALLIQPAASQAIVPAREAYEAARAGRILLVDIRTPAEWTDSGVALGAVKLDAASAAFEVRLAGLRLDNVGKRIVLIDRTGGLAASVQQTLAQRGWRDLRVIRGGMLGPGGWLAEKLPLEQ
jgi:rhodanese-related sulfurtransferase